jgi:hypothetical protein
LTWDTTPRVVADTRRVWWPPQDVLKVSWFKVCSVYGLFRPFAVDRAYYEELNAKLPKEVDDHH